MIAEAALAAAVIAGISAADPMPDLTAPASAPVMTGEHLPYRGRFWRASQADFTRCVLRRESNTHWFSTNRAHGYFGGFQFSAALARGATWMMLPELRSMYGPELGKRISAELRRTEMHRWRPLFQHMAFATVLNWEHDGSGARHWAGGRWACSLAGAR